MALEKAFAIKAEPAAVWRALTGELQIADEATFSIEQIVTNELLSLWVNLQGGIRSLLTYRLVPREDHTEVVATMEPHGLRYTVFRAITLGRSDTNYELLLVEGLANLKLAVEGGEQPTAGSADEAN